MELYVKRLLEAVSTGTSPYHTVKEAEKKLLADDFKELLIDKEFTLKRGEAYYITPFQSTLIAFRVNPNFSPEDQIRIVTSHVDTPGLRIKANAEYPYKNYERINIEVYGGAILNTWLDRPLGVAGIVCIKGEDKMNPEVLYLDCRRPLFVIPNVSIHMNREINKGTELNAQIDMLPIGGTKKELNQQYFLEFLAKELEINVKDILSYDLCLYNVQEGVVCGMGKDMIVAPRLDNLTSVQACLTALTESKRPDGIDMIVLFDHEEIGSRTLNGAVGNLLPFILERIYIALEVSRATFLKSIMGGFLLSADVAHAVNPNHPEKYDPTSAIQINDGISIKCASKKSYAGDAKIWAILKELGEEKNIPCHFNYTRSDIPGGSTLGAILSAVLPMRSADIGAPILAMHSAMETMGAEDQLYLEQFLTSFFNL